MENDETKAGSGQFTPPVPDIPTAETASLVKVPAIDEIEKVNDGPGEIITGTQETTLFENDPADAEPIPELDALKKGDRIILSLPSGQSVRLTIVKVSVEQNSKTGVTDGIYTFNDGSALSFTSLEEDGYSWKYDAPVDTTEEV